jgi:hypothetical protein
LGRLFLNTGKTLIDMETGELKFRVDGTEVTFNINIMIRQKKEKSESYKVDLVETLIWEQLETPNPGVDQVILQSLEKEDDSLDEETNLSVRWLSKEDSVRFPQKYKPLEFDPNEKPKQPELKELPKNLKYIFLGEEETQPTIISNSLTPENEERLLAVLKKNKEALGWSINDLKGISPAYCMHNIKMEDEYKPVVQPQRRLNPAMSEVVRNKVNKLLASGMIYPISDSPEHESLQVCYKKHKFTIASCLKVR